MAEISNSAVVGAFSVRPTSDQLFDLRRYDKALGYAGHARLHEFPASFFVIPLMLHTAANNNTKVSLAVKAPWPLTIWAADLGCESAAGSAATADVLVAGATILDAPEDIKTGAGTGQRVAPETGKADVDYNATIALSVVGTGSGDVVGASAYLYCQRR